MMTDSESAQEQQPQPPLKQKQLSHNHADGINGNGSSPDSAAQPKQIIGRYSNNPIHNCSQSLCVLHRTSKCVGVLGYFVLYNDNFWHTFYDKVN